MGKTTLIDLKGSVFGRWTVLEKYGNTSKFWVCRCSCGIVRRVNGANLRQGATHSCGCGSAEATAKRITTHGHTGTRAHNIWLLMKDRCFNKSNNRYSSYGGRGITVCPQWRNDFATFLKDMGVPPPGYSIERINNDGGYEPGNCCWIPLGQQSRNRRNTIRITAFGREMLQADWARFLGTTPSHVWYALKSGHTIEWLAKHRGAGVAIND